MDRSTPTLPRGPLLTTKLNSPPARPNLVMRPRLLDELDRSLSEPTRLTLFSAPAGFGKTTLLNSWAHTLTPFPSRLERKSGAQVRVAWLSLDEGDNDPAYFLSYLIAALQTVHPEVGRVILAALESPQPPPLQEALTTLINEIAVLSRDLVLVMDDYHVIQAPPVHAALTFLLDNLPRHLHLIISTRADPPLPLARLRARGQMIEIRAADLRFTPDEAAAFLSDVMGLGLSAGDIAALEDRTEGWIAGLQMAALSMRGENDTAGFIRALTGSNRFILDYLGEEVFQRQPESIQSFLLETCILDRLTAPLCDVVTGGQKGEQTLDRLERENLFIIPLDDERRWYRYHTLFADLLRHRLKRTYPRLEPDLHRRAASWYEQQGDISAALNHLFAAQDFADAARLVEANGMALLDRGRLAELMGWIRQIPEPLVAARPWLSIYNAWVLLLTGQVQAVEPRLRAAEGALQTSRSPVDLGIQMPLRSMSGHIAAIRAYVAVLSGDIPRTIQLARQAREQLPPEAASVQSTVAFLLGGASILADDQAGAEAAFAEAAKLGEAAGNIHVAVPAMCALANLRATSGDLHEAFRIYHDALRLATGHNGHPLPIAATASVGIGSLLYEWNDLAAAARYLEMSVELSRLWGNADNRVWCNLCLARLRQTQGDLNRALELLEEAEQIARRSTLTPPMQASVAAHRMCAWLAKGDRESASRLAKERDLSTGGELSPQREVEHAALARLLLAQGEFDAALRLLEQLLGRAEAAGRKRRVIELLIIRSLALQAKGDISGALTMLNRALSIAEPQGYVRAFLDEGAPMIELLRRAGSRGILPRYVAELLSASATAVETPSPAQQPLVEPLSERELQVLRLIAAGLSNQEIARRLVVALGTVKAHTSTIFRKLNVGTRTQAVARARDLNLI